MKPFTNSTLVSNIRPTVFGTLHYSLWEGLGSTEFILSRHSLYIKYAVSYFMCECCSQFDVSARVMAIISTKKL